VFFLAIFPTGRGTTRADVGLEGRLSPFCIEGFLTMRKPALGTDFDVGRFPGRALELPFEERGFLVAFPAGRATIRDDVGLVGRPDTLCVTGLRTYFEPALDPDFCVGCTPARVLGVRPFDGRGLEDDLTVGFGATFLVAFPAGRGMMRADVGLGAGDMDFFARALGLGAALLREAVAAFASRFEAGMAFGLSREREFEGLEESFVAGLERAAERDFPGP
jgi:hypothetical protein